MRDMQDRNPVLKEALVFMSVRLANDSKKYVALALVYFQYRNHLSKSRIFTEMLYVLFAAKPGVDAYRVVLCAEKEVGALMDPRSEMVVSKCWELFAEAIPGSLIQTCAFLVGSNQPNAAIFSLVFSVFTASFTSTGVSFDFDMDKNARVQSPNFYGYVPGETKKKVKVFASMFFISACQLSAKALSCVLCAVESSMTVVFYLVGESQMLLFLAYKLFRRDFTYWIPVYGLGEILQR
ncbi:hypothetical protein TrLO_g1893 [Triparma laevis f. longispina]|uniref:Uncharacterized protein n=1 Tax=Triparma laevis f. longispina TaxID=1714387 RepID=A0A9W7FIJ1_9STRA|nr:hypothetical protein TrLO_g1893 [Triparma laevis f. longispina]